MSYQEVVAIIETIPGVMGKDLKTTFSQFIATEDRQLKIFYGNFETVQTAHVILEAKKAGLVEELFYSNRFNMEIAKIMQRMPAIIIGEEEF